MVLWKCTLFSKSCLSAYCPPGDLEVLLAADIVNVKSALCTYSIGKPRTYALHFIVETLLFLPKYHGRVNKGNILRNNNGDL